MIAFSLLQVVWPFLIPFTIHKHSHFLPPFPLLLPSPSPARLVILHCPFSPSTHYHVPSLLFRISVSITALRVPFCLQVERPCYSDPLQRAHSSCRSAFNHSNPHRILLYLAHRCSTIHSISRSVTLNTPTLFSSFTRPAIAVFSPVYRP